MSKSLKTILKNNVLKQMAARGIDSPTKLAKKCLWPASYKKGGTKVSPRIMGYLLGDDDNDHWPSLALVESIAKALDVPIWELLVEKEEERRDLLDKILAMSAPSDQHMEGILGYPPKKEKTK